jgi:hypothetical protein
MTATISYHYTGGSSNSNPDLSLGGVTSSVVIDNVNPLHNLYKKVEEATREIGTVEYAVVGIVNNGDTDSVIQNLYILADTSSADTDISIGIDTVAGSHPLSTALQTLVNKTTPPSNPAITFSKPTVQAPIVCPSILVGQCLTMHIKYTVNASSVSFAGDLARIRMAVL